MKETDTCLKRWLCDALDVFNRELHNILHDKGVMLVFVAAGFLYPLLYNFVYKNGLLEDTPVAVVDNADCGDTRRMIREMDASREIDIVARCLSMEEAKELFRQRKVNGIIYFPADFGARLARKETAVFSIYADMSSFLYYKNLLMGSEFVMLHEINQIKAERGRFDGLTETQADQSVRSVRYEDINPYNRAFSYNIFLLSAILMLIVQQVMFYGMSMMAGTMREENRSFASLPDRGKWRGVGRVVLGRGAVYWLLFMVIGLYVAFIVPALFGFPQRGAFRNIFLLLCIFVSACVFFCMTWSTLVTRRESAFLLFLFMSPLILFLTGFSWPETAFPACWKWFSWVFPSTFGCRAFIDLNTAGADISVVTPELRALCLQGGVYLLLAAIAVCAENCSLKKKAKIKSV